ncbi:hypothetical protein Glove_212g181 [Diversispora epigaea]|uniref:Uncharacterized protein n=1 Tax=Diversispora epigaea TaxID=1348612 RepID=A0A397IL39_9GLOM|nr:hypothetical protein Glove_212g181 [Diversispora epigaea]
MSSSRLGTKDLENCNPNRSERIQAVRTSEISRTRERTYRRRFFRQDASHESSLLPARKNISTSCHYRTWELKTSKIAILTGANESRLLERPKSPEPANELTEGDSSAGTPVTEAHSFQRNL